MTIRIGANPIGWSNDDMRELGGETSLETCLSEAKQAGFAGMELGHKFPREPEALRTALAPFGLAWYQGDIETDSHGNGSGTFVGRFNVETFIVAPGVAPAPVVFNHPPFPDANQNPKTPPVQLYHLGLWFNSPADAARAGCASTVTPFNGTHNAGIQALNTANFPLLRGPLFYLQ